MSLDLNQKTFEKAIVDIGARVSEGNPIDEKSFSSDDLDVLYSIGYSLYETGDFEQARELFQQLVISKPFEKSYWFGYGATLQMAKAYRESLVAWSMCALIDNTDPLPHFHAGECLLSLKEIEEALLALNEAKVRLKEDGILKNKIEELEKAWKQGDSDGTN